MITLAIGALVTAALSFLSYWRGHEAGYIRGWNDHTTCETYGDDSRMRPGPRDILPFRRDR